MGLSFWILDCGFLTLLLLLLLLLLLFVAQFLLSLARFVKVSNHNHSRHSLTRLKLVTNNVFFGWLICLLDRFHRFFVAGRERRDQGAG